MSRRLTKLEFDRRTAWKQLFAQALDGAAERPSAKDLAANTTDCLRRFGVQRVITAAHINQWLYRSMWNPANIPDVRVPSSDEVANALAHAMAHVHVWDGVAAEEKAVKMRAIVESLGFRFRPLGDARQELIGTVFQHPIVLLSTVCRWEPVTQILEVLTQPYARQEIRTFLERDGRLLIASYHWWNDSDALSATSPAPNSFTMKRMPGYFRGLLLALEKLMLESGDAQATLIAWKTKVRFALLKREAGYFGFCPPRQRLVCGIRVLDTTGLANENWFNNLATIVESIPVAVVQPDGFEFPTDNEGGRLPFMLNKEELAGLVDIVIRHLHSDLVLCWYAVNPALTVDDVRHHVPAASDEKEILISVSAASKRGKTHKSEGTAKMRNKSMSSQRKR